jgi:3'-5' exoribonuclease
VATIAELVEDRTVEGVYAVTKKERRRTRAGAPYLALELADASGRIEARVWSDVDLLERRFGEGDAVRVLGRVERFGGRLQLQVRAVEAAEDADPEQLTPSLRRDVEELDGFLEFLAAEVSHAGLAALVERFLRDPEIRAGLRTHPAAGVDGHHGYAGGLLEHTVGVATLCRETAQLHPRLRSDLLLAAALLHDVGRIRELTRGPAFRQTEEGRLLGHVHLGLRMIEERAGQLDAGPRAELLHAVACHHDRQAARTAEAAALYHANQLDAQAATRPVGDD